MGQSVFDSLVRTLDEGERRDMLLKISKSGAVSSDPLFPPDTQARAREDVEDPFKSLGFLAKLWVTVRAFFSGVPKSDVLRRDEVKSIAKGIVSRFPGLFDPAEQSLLEPFLNEAQKLKRSAYAIKAMYEGSIGADRGSFYGLLGSLEMPEVHRALVERTDPGIVFESNPLLEDAEVRRIVLAALDEILSGTDDDARNRIYFDVRAMHFLNRIAEFPFERLLAFFEKRKDGSRACPAGVVADRLAELANVLYSMAEAPPPVLLEAIILYCKRNELDGEDASVESRVREELQKLDASLVAIRDFNARVPLHDIVRVVRSDPGWGASELPGGEDWFSAYRQFWKDRVDSKVAAFKATREAARLARQIAEYVGGRDRWVFLAGTDGKRIPGDEVPASRLESALAFLYDFDRYLFGGELQRPLKTILLEGQFYKKENRSDFVEAYNALLSMRESVTNLEAKLRPSGEYGQAYAQARGEVISIPLKRHRIQAIMQSVDDEASQIAQAARTALEALVAILGGILKGGFGERFDSLSNLSRIGGKSNEEFVRSVSVSKDRIEQGLTILRALEAARVVLAEP